MKLRLLHPSPAMYLALHHQDVGMCIHNEMGSLCAQFRFLGESRGLRHWFQLHSLQVKWLIQFKLNDCVDNS